MATSGGGSRSASFAFNFVKSHSTTLRLFIGAAAAIPIVAGCSSEQKLNQGMGTALAPFYHYPMVGSGGYDLLFCSGAFRRRNERWPKDYSELTQFVDESGGYLALGKYERVEFTPLPNDGVQIAFVPYGLTNELKFSVAPGPRSQ